MRDFTFWYDFETDQWTVSDGERTETISPFLREAFIRYYQRDIQDMRIENDDLINEAAAIREHNYRLRRENAQLRALLEATLQCAGETKRDKGCDACPMYNGPWRNDGTWCLLRHTLRELGVEMDG